MTVPEKHNRTFEALRHVHAEGGEYWSARELFPVLEYSRWEKFKQLIEKAKIACETAGATVSDHFHLEVKMVDLGSGSKREIEDYHLSRYACYLIVQNGDPTKPVIALGQTYFAIQTRRQELADDAAFKAYNVKKIANKGDWRRDNINQFVQKLGQSVAQAKPSVSYGISPYGVWRNNSNDLTGSDTKASVTAYDSTYADVRTWIKHEWIDYVAPQIYWSMTRKEVRYDLLADWWASEVRGTNVKLYIGHAPYKLGTPEIGWSSAQEIIDQLNYNRQVPEISGSIFFSAKDLRKNPLGLIPLLQSYYGM